MKIADVKYIESGSFQGVEEDVSDAEIEYGEPCVVMSKKTFMRLKEGLTKLANYDSEPIWKDDRDDAADYMLRLASKLLEGANG